MMRRSTRMLGAVALVVALFFLSGCGEVSNQAKDGKKNSQQQKKKQKEKKQEKKQTPKPKKTGAEGTALATVAQLPVKGRAPLTGYERSAFGAAWKDVDDNGCDTRNDILRRDLSNIVDDGGSACVVKTGVLNPEPYTARNVTYTRGKSTLDIDHVVALGNAWVSGAWKWSSEKRLRIANDPLNLLAVDYSANRQKGDADAATWLPPNKPYRCQYVARQVAVKHEYGLTTTKPEKTAMTNVLETCPKMKLPAR